MDQYPNPENRFDASGRNAKIFGIVSLIVAFCCCGVIGIILAVVALVCASNSKRLMGQVTKDAELGKILAIIAIVVGVLSLLSSLGFAFLILIEELPEFLPAH